MSNNIFSAAESFNALNASKIKRLRQYVIVICVVLYSPILMLIGNTDDPWYVIVADYFLAVIVFCTLSTVLPVWSAKRQFNNQLKVYNHQEIVDIAAKLNFKLHIVNVNSKWNFAYYVAKGQIAGYPVDIEGKVYGEENLLVLFHMIPKEIGKENFKRIQAELKPYKADFDFGGVSIRIPFNKISSTLTLNEDAKAVAAILVKEGFEPDFENA